MIHDHNLRSTISANGVDNVFMAVAREACRNTNNQSSLAISCLNYIRKGCTGSGNNESSLATSCLNYIVRAVRGQGIQETSAVHVMTAALNVAWRRQQTAALLQSLGGAGAISLSITW